jgi:plastocyanin
MRRILIVVAALSVLAAACGGDDGDEGAPPADTGATGATPATGTTGATGATGAVCPDLTGEGDTFAITIGDNFFEPSCFTASASQMITITNEGSAAHTFTMVDTGIDVEIAAGDQFQGEAISGAVEPGTYELICRFHEASGMVGQVTVVA